VRLVFLSAIPVAVSDFYIRLMSGIMQAFSKKDAIDAAVGAKDGAALWKALTKATRATVK
jgi:mannitol/fructose-specific phosphotransferase system IIA component (Ntr-type)